MSHDDSPTDLQFKGAPGGKIDDTVNETQLEKPLKQTEEDVSERRKNIKNQVLEDDKTEVLLHLVNYMSPNDNTQRNGDTKFEIQSTLESDERRRYFIVEGEMEVDMQKEPKKNKRVLSFADVVISVTVIGPLVIGFWRGVWNWMDLYSEVFPAWSCFAIGVGVHAAFAFTKNRLYARLAENRLHQRFLRILYAYVFGMACILHWRGGWILLDPYLIVHYWITTSLTSLMIIAMAILRCVRNLLATPLVVAIDDAGGSFDFPTRYNANTRDWSLYLLDCAFSVGIVGTLVVFVWRGVWILFDLYLFPKDRKYSALGSLVIGYAIVAVTFCLQPLMRYVCTRLKGLSRLLAADAFLLLSFLGTVNVWRGIWNVLDLWLLPENPELSCWITHIGCFLFLVLLNCSNSILVRGVYIDAEEDEGKCVVFPCHYLRLFFKIEREKKEARRRNLLLATRDLAARSDTTAKDTENGAFLPNSTPSTILPAVDPESLA